MKYNRELMNNLWFSVYDALEVMKPVSIEECENLSEEMHNKVEEAIIDYINDDDELSECRDNYETYC